MEKTTTTLGAITPGEAIVELHHEGPYYGNITVIKEPGVIQTISCQLKYAPHAEQVANAALYVDAHNTAQKTGKLPSQLLQERDAKDTELQRLRSQVEAMMVAGSALRKESWEFWDQLAKNGSGWFPNTVETQVLMTAICNWDASLNPTPTTEQK